MDKLDQAQISAGKKKEAVKAKTPSMGRSRKGCMRGKGGPENALCTYWGVRQRTWGKRVAEICEPNRGARLWLGTFNTSLEAALAYTEAAKELYGPSMTLNLPAMTTTITAPPIDSDDNNSNFSAADSSNSCISEQAVKSEAIDASSHDPFVMRDATTSGTMGDADYNCVDWSWENLVVPDMVSEDDAEA